MNGKERGAKLIEFAVRYEFTQWSDLGMDLDYSVLAEIKYIFFSKIHQLSDRKLLWFFCTLSCGHTGPRMNLQWDIWDELQSLDAPLESTCSACLDKTRNVHVKLGPVVLAESHIHNAAQGREGKTGQRLGSCKCGSRSTYVCCTAREDPVSTVGASERFEIWIVLRRLLLRFLNTMLVKVACKFRVKLAWSCEKTAKLEAVCLRNTESLCVSRIMMKCPGWINESCRGGAWEKEEPINPKLWGRSV